MVRRQPPPYTPPPVPLPAPRRRSLWPVLGVIICFSWLIAVAQPLAPLRLKITQLVHDHHVPSLNLKHLLPSTSLAPVKPHANAPGLGVTSIQLNPAFSLSVR